MFSRFPPFCLALWGLLVLGNSAKAEDGNPYGLPELGLSVQRSTLAGPASNALSSGLFADMAWSINPYFDIGWSLDASPSLPMGVHLSSYDGLSFDIGDPKHWTISVFADIQSAAPTLEALATPGMAFQGGIRGVYVYDLYEAGAEIGYVAPMGFNDNGASVQGAQDGGMAARLWAKAELPFTRQFKVKAGVEALVADKTYNNLYFGVTAEQAEESGLSEYKANAGPVYAGVNVEARYLLDKDWVLRAAGSLTRFVGPAIDSPIVREHGAYQSQLEASIIYRF